MFIAVPLKFDHNSLIIPPCVNLSNPAITKFRVTHALTRQVPLYRFTIRVGVPTSDMRRGHNLHGRQTPKQALLPVILKSHRNFLITSSHKYLGYFTVTKLWMPDMLSGLVPQS